ncbi:hypothetical protein ACFWVC_32320 [Streptomyces sp. NPDC058691]|uniref:hypothetical protein n=1 Tax=Streptomyces sp. NPDC058691 TaxID=3346601 RepID=UPI00365AC387
MTWVQRFVTTLSRLILAVVFTVIGIRTIALEITEVHGMAQLGYLAIGTVALGGAAVNWQMLLRPLFARREQP